ncbi:MAG: hypothetical protein GX580_02905 [Candidatus Hydrogenedens sp.]|nr:hypothetical protein [Candidatus Hydrogenedentota bacterium]NLF56568.1 hypothetical protein [Candidatus Hydrogenedens sp.]
MKEDIKDAILAFAGLIIPFIILLALGFGTFWGGLLTLAVGRWIFYFLVCGVSEIIFNLRPLPKSDDSPGEPTP